MNEHTTYPQKEQHYDIAIIGAGLAGSLCAHKLAQAGCKVCIIDKSRGSGGRASSKRLDNNASCELGAPFIHVTHADVHALFEPLREAKVAALWEAASLPNAPAYVGTPKMSAITRYWLGSCHFITNTRVHHIEHNTQHSDGYWRIRDSSYQSVALAKRIIIATPAAQAANILSTMKDVETLLLSANRAAQTNQPQWAMWVETASSDASPIMAPQGSSISRIIKDSSKPQRQQDGMDRWVLHSSSTWTKQHLDDNKESIAATLIDAFANETQLTPIKYGVPHRWLLGRCLPALDDHPFKENATQTVFVTGDWLCQGDGEGSLISALSLCEQLIKQHDTN